MASPSTEQTSVTTPSTPPSSSSSNNESPLPRTVRRNVIAPTLYPRQQPSLAAFFFVPSPPCLASLHNQNERGQPSGRPLSIIVSSHSWPLFFNVSIYSQVWLPSFSLRQQPSLAALSPLLVPNGITTRSLT